MDATLVWFICHVDPLYIVSPVVEALQVTKVHNSGVRKLQERGEELILKTDTTDINLLPVTTNTTYTPYMVQRVRVTTFIF